ncbi:hypothetical protein [Streptomyces atriruber]|uniref:hypothetical protein n=1 Tax=Streptomyces atriruber TaxID=545121 RepID=UPI0006E1D85F|nr:hypothetical protein [Streptomyces atriruber]
MRAPTRRMRFDGWIAGLGTEAGVRLVVGRWPVSPLGSFADVMVEHADGHRALLAPSQQVAEFVSATYRFDEVVICPVAVRPARERWTVAAGPLRLAFDPGRSTALGRLLRAVPGRLASSPGWAALCDVPARLLMPGVRTRGSAGTGRREWYAARDLRTITAARATWDGRDLGGLTRVDPPVRFGFGSVPRRPSLTRVVTTVELATTELP